MQTEWQSFIQSQSLTESINQINTPSIAPLSHLSVLSVSGADAAKFLQGQVTCDVNKLVENKAQLGAYCNAKGRTITSFIIIRIDADTLYIILPRELITQVQKKLQMYIMRADVKLTDQTESLCILGLYDFTASPEIQCYNYLDDPKRQLIINDHANCLQLVSQLLTTQSVQLINPNVWTALDILAGIPWLNTKTSELFVPQMLKLDELNAISFEKGCYTGQEVVARTHYLGKNKRIMLLAKCAANVIVPDACEIVTETAPENILGTLVLQAKQDDVTLLLIVLKESPNELLKLQFNNEAFDAITLNK